MSIMRATENSLGRALWFGPSLQVLANVAYSLVISKGFLAHGDPEPPPSKTSV